LENPSPTEFIVKFPFSKIPGTHIVDLNSMTIKDVTLKSI